MTDLEARIYIKTGKELKVILLEMIQDGKSTREVATFLEIAEASVRRYAASYGLSFYKKILKEHQKFSFEHAKKG